MLEDNHQEITKKLRILMTKFERKLPLRIKAIEAQCNTLFATAWDRRVAKQLSLGLHKLSGTGTSFGFKRLSLTSHQMEEYVARLLKNDKKCC